MNTADTTQQSKQESGILVSVVTQQGEQEEESLQELRKLADTAGMIVLDQMVQRRESHDPRWVMGKGKVQELKALTEQLDADVIIFDHELTGAQVRNIEEVLQVKILDRTQLILDIFAQRAKTKEGQLQVELAQLNYLLPRLIGHGKQLSRLGAGIGTRGPGETKLETDRRHIRTRIRDLKRQLEQVTKHRKLYRERRQKNGVPQVALVGYTNAGKSTLLNQLTGADTLSENRLFATLDPTTRKLKLPSGREIMLTDTVGFIQRLPHDLVAAFKSTLEEVLEADLILHVVDASHPYAAEQIRVVDDVLGQLGAQGKEQILVYNKMDQVSQQEAVISASSDHPNVKLSALDRKDLHQLKLSMQDWLFGQLVAYRIPSHEGKLLSTAYSLGDIVHQSMEEEEAYVCVRTTKSQYTRKGYLLKRYEVEPANCTEENRHEEESADESAMDTTQVRH
ncbi:GTPase HflX [Marinicrinis sediminis]|uniref:GTPase HflX n=1 Tax=Marinicrinis sediminis TaxID=1652465 RepID=A0ABW5RD92_9BACL